MTTNKEIELQKYKIDYIRGYIFNPAAVMQSLEIVSPSIQKALNYITESMPKATVFSIVMVKEYDHK
jgi:hypothetical protein